MRCDKLGSRSGVVSGLEDASRINCALTAERRPSAPTNTSHVALVPSENVSVMGEANWEGLEWG